jgi:hypothetical protein
MYFEGSNSFYNSENIISLLKINNKLNNNLLFNIEEVLKDYANPHLETFKPKGGYEFTDKSNYNEGIGIYHSHLESTEKFQSTFKEISPMNCPHHCENFLKN